MNTQYLFRGKRVDNGEWVQGFVMLYEHRGNKFAQIINDFREEDEKQTSYNMIRVDPSTVGQCTGLRDKNRTLIFDGDIIRDIFKADDIYIGNVAWNRRTLSWSVRRRGTVGHMPLIEFTAEDNITCKTAEIIGNIHDTPELLKEV